jgi:CHASE2 domain-containing sensor protein
MTETGGTTKRRRALFPRPLLLSAVFALLSTLLLAEVLPRYAPGLLRFDHAMGDVRIAYLSDRLPSQHPQVAIVRINDETLKDLKVRQPIDRAILAKIVEAVDTAGAKAIGVDFLFTQVTPPDNEQMLIDALKQAKAKVVLAAGDNRVGLSKAQDERQLQFIAATGRPAGYVNLATERDWMVRFKARPAGGTSFPQSFSSVLAESVGVPGSETGRVPWLLDPADGSDAFLTVPAELLLKGPNDQGARLAHAGLKDKLVIIGSWFPDIDRHLTPFSVAAGELQPGALLHANMLSGLLDGRHVVQLETNSLVVRLELIVITALAFLVGWRTRTKPQGLLLGSAATVAIIAVDTFVFWYWRIVLPFVLALMAWFLGEFAGHYLGKWLGPRTDRSRGLVT